MKSFTYASRSSPRYRFIRLSSSQSRICFSAKQFCIKRRNKVLHFVHWSCLHVHAPEVSQIFRDIWSLWKLSHAQICIIGVGFHRVKAANVFPYVLPTNYWNCGVMYSTGYGFTATWTAYLNRSMIQRPSPYMSQPSLYIGPSHKDYKLFTRAYWSPTNRRCQH